MLIELEEAQVEELVDIEEFLGVHDAEEEEGKPENMWSPGKFDESISSISPAKEGWEDVSEQNSIDEMREEENGDDADDAEEEEEQTEEKLSNEYAEILAEEADDEREEKEDNQRRRKRKNLLDCLFPSISFNAEYLIF